MKEEWIELASASSTMYRLSNYGCVVNVRTGKPVKGYLTPSGMMKVTLQRTNARPQQSYSVAKLVLKYFHPESVKEGDFTLFFDGDKSNCRLDNLYSAHRAFRTKYKALLRSSLTPPGATHFIIQEIGNTVMGGGYFGSEEPALNEMVRVALGFNEGGFKDMPTSVTLWKIPANTPTPVDQEEIWAGVSSYERFENSKPKK